jgi:hypothetical protein
MRFPWREIDILRVGYAPKHLRGPQPRLVCQERIALHRICRRHDVVIQSHEEQLVPGPLNERGARRTPKPVSPRLQWTNVPQNTVSVGLLMHDEWPPDIPDGHSAFGKHTGNL